MNQPPVGFLLGGAPIRPSMWTMGKLERQKAKASEANFPRRTFSFWGEFLGSQWQIILGDRPLGFWGSMSGTGAGLSFPLEPVIDRTRR